MAELTLPYRIFNALSRIPGLYPVLIWMRRVASRKVRQIIASVLRALVPASAARFGPPKQWVSLYQSLQANDASVEGGVILHRQELTPFGPGSMSAMSEAKPERWQPFPIIWSHHKNARLVTRTLGLVLPPKTLVVESTYGKEALWAEPAYNYAKLPRPIRLEGNFTSIVSYWVPNNAVANFSHWLLDALPRTAALDRFPSDTQIIVPGQLAGYQRESLDLLGLAGRYRPTPERHLVVADYYLSSPPSIVVCESAYSLAFLRERLLPKASPQFTGPKRFIIDRVGVTRGVQNDDEFKQFFRDLGWAIIDTAKFSLADEMKLFRDAEAFCGAIGSGFTNAVWCQPGCAVIQFATEQVFDGSTEWICARNNLRWRFMICPADGRQKAYIDLKKVRGILEELDLL